MTLPRPVLIALLGVALCAAAFLATRSASDTGSAVTTVTPDTQTPPVHKAKPDQAAPAAQKPSVEKSQAPAPTTAKPESAAPTSPAKPAKPQVTGEAAKTLPAIKALARGDVVVFFFTQPGAADDTGTREAVKTLKGEKGVSVFTIGLDDLETFGPVLNGAGVSQVPAVVIVRAGQNGRLLQGYVDSRTLHQTVADARR